MPQRKLRQQFRAERPVKPYPVTPETLTEPAITSIPTQKRRMTLQNVLRTRVEPQRRPATTPDSRRAYDDELTQRLTEIRRCDQELVIQAMAPAGAGNFATSIYNCSWIPPEHFTKGRMMKPYEPLTLCELLDTLFLL